MGAVQVGDLLFDENGNPCRVVGKSEVTTKEAVEVMFQDGARVVCDLGHRWPVKDYGKLHDSGLRRRIATTEEIAGRVKMHQNRNRYGVRCAAPLDLPAVELPLDPYIFGLWLGDGHSYSARISFNAQDLADDLEREVLARGFTLIPANSNADTVAERNVHDANGSIFSALKNLGVLKNKHIPDAYLRAGLSQRWDLFRGIMDTDGTASPAGGCAVTFKRVEFANGFVELARTLGLKAKVKPHKVLYEGERRTYHMVTFTGYPELHLFNLKRKQAQLSVERAYYRYSDSRERRIVAVNPAGVRQVQCLAVDSPSNLFLCSEWFVPTHNTELINNVLGYFVHLDPSPVIVMQPTEKMARAWSQDRLDKMIRDTPVLREQFGTKKARESSNTILHKEFPGGHVTVVGANAPSDLAMRPVRVILCDEVDKYPASAGKEGDPIKLISERSATFWNSLKVHVCSPTVEGRSRIAYEYEQSDQRIYEVPCPKCRHPQEMKWTQVRWKEGDPESAAYHCESCGVAWSEIERLKAVGRGTWRATQPFKGHAGFRASKLVSPWEPLSKIAEKFLAAKKDADKLKVFVNTQLAETWKERGDAPEWERIYERREKYKIGTVPAGVMFLTAGVDVQDNRLEVEVVGWGRDKQSWSIEVFVFEGSTASEGDRGEGGVWAKLDGLLNESWESADGQSFSIQVMAVDSGFRTQTVYNWCRKYQMNRVIAVKGNDRLSVLMSSGTMVDVKRGRVRAARAFKVFTLGVGLLKTELYGWLRLPAPIDGETPHAGYCHFPEYDPEFFKQLTAEELMRKVVNGQAVYHWEKTRERNEALDRRLYARAAASFYGLDRFKPHHWERLGVAASETPPAAPQKGEERLQTNPERPKLKRRPSTFL
jgi:phage terminase large subunit GpA-like protein